jgi:hypothetical protein
LSGDFVTQNQRKRMTRGNAIESKADIRVTNPAARYLYNHFAVARFQSREFANFQRRIGYV